MCWYKRAIFIITFVCKFTGSCLTYNYWLWAHGQGARAPEKWKVGSWMKMRRRDKRLGLPPWNKPGWPLLWPNANNGADRSTISSGAWGSHWPYKYLGRVLWRTKHFLIQGMTLDGYKLKSTRWLWNMSTAVSFPENSRQDSCGALRFVVLPRIA